MNQVKQAETAAISSTTQQIVVFKLGKEEYGLKIDQIKEVVITPAITKMPQTPPYMRGVANIRGNVIAILDLEEKFDVSRQSEANIYGNNFTLVLASDEYKVGILVREVPNTLSVSSGSLETSVFAGEQSHNSYVTGIVKLDKRLIIMIDIFKVIDDNDTHQLLKKSVENVEV